MLRSKGGVAGGRREVIINLDSIEEENGNEDMGVSMRKQERLPTTNEKMF